MKKFDLIEIDWVDSVGCSGVWNCEDGFDFERHDRSMFFKSCGFFIKKTKIATYLCQSIRTNWKESSLELGELFSIPNSVILSIKIIEGK